MNLWNMRTRIDARIQASVLAMLGATITTAFIALQMSSDLASTIRATGSRQMLAGKIAAGTAEFSDALRGVAMAAMLSDADEMRKAQKSMRDANTVIGESIQAMSQFSSSDSGLQKTLGGFREDHGPLQANLDKIEKMIATQQIDRAMELFNSSMKPAIQRMNVNAKGLVASESQDFDKTVNAAATKTARGRMVTLLVLGAAGLVGLVVFWVAWSITKSLRSIANDLSQCSGQVTGASRQVSATSQELSHDAASQAAALHETSTATEELSALTRENADRAQSVTGMIRDTEAAVLAGNSALTEMEGAMKAIGTSSDKIKRIIQVIDEIAFQTNILALNAAVEAARAGEAGMGFAVVADEVRNLAQRSAQAARDTTGLIEESISRAADGSRKLGHVSKSIVSITEYSKKVKVLAEEVSTGSAEQARGISEIARTLRTVEQATQRGQMAADQTQDAGQQLSGQAVALDQTIQQLAAMVGGVRSSDAHVFHSGPEIAFAGAQNQ
jgi:methyl-accepting chemotaxis protein